MCSVDFEDATIGLDYTLLTEKHSSEWKRLDNAFCVLEQDSKPQHAVITTPDFSSVYHWI